MILPRSPEAVDAFFEAQNGLGESPPHSNQNWITRATHFEGSPWCAIGLSLAYIAAGFNADGKILDFGTPDRPPNWANSVPDIAGLGFATTYRWGSAYTWSFSEAASDAGRWSTDLDAGKPGDVVLINHNGRGGARDGNSHTCLLIGRQADGSFLTYNGNVRDSICQAIWTPGTVEGFCHPAFVTTPTPSPTLPTEEDMAFRFNHRNIAYVSDGIGRRKIATTGLNEALARARVHRDGTEVEVWPPLWLDGGQEVADDVFNLLVDLDK